MAVNENVNKVVCYGDVLIDLTSDTVEPAALLEGYTAHDASGELITGTLELVQTHEHSGATVEMPSGETFSRLDIIGNTSNGESISGFNLFNDATSTAGYYINSSGVVTSDTSNSKYTELIPVVPGVTYTIAGISGRANNKRLHGYDSNGTWKSQITYFAQNNMAVGTVYSTQFTPGSNIRYIRYSYAGEDTNIQITKTSTVQQYLPYGCIGVIVTSILGVQKALVAVDLDGQELESYSETADILTITSSGGCSLAKNGSNPSIVQLPSVSLPSISAGDTFSLLANIGSSFVLVCTSGGIIDADLISKQIIANGTYSAENDDADGYSSVSVNVPNSYTASDEGKVVSSGALVSQTSTTKNANGTYNTTTNNQVIVNVPNSYSSSDEGKVVSSGALVSQSSVTKTVNGTYDTTLNNQVVVNVQPNLGTKSISANGTYAASTDSLDGYSSVTVNISGGGVYDDGDLVMY